MIIIIAIFHHEHSNFIEDNEEFKLGGEDLENLNFKNSYFPNISPQFIVQFDQILKDISKISKFPVDSTCIYHYTPQFSLNSPNW